MTHDPRIAGSGIPPALPFCLFQRQSEFLDFLLQLTEQQISGLVEKSRDMGATWLSVNYAVWLWLFRPGSSIGFGSRKEQLVDRRGDMDSIFEKIRFSIDWLPRVLLPTGFQAHIHSAHMRILNPASGSSITGEAGDNIGRGGRKLIYFKDEAAHYERPQMIESALMDNTNVQIDISSVNGTGNVFHRRRLSGVVWAGEITEPDRTQVFIMDWRDHPAKTKQWYERRREKSEREGLTALFAREVDRSYSASVQGVVIPAIWIEAAIGLANDFEIDTSGKKRAGLDVGDDGIDGDKNALCLIEGLEIKSIEQWGLVDTGVTARRAWSRSIEFGANELQYDAIGVGSGVKAAMNTLAADGVIGTDFIIVPWTASSQVQDPWGYVDPPDPADKTPHDGPLNRDFFANFKAQSWWNIRRRFRNAWLCRDGQPYDSNNVISISDELSRDNQRILVEELSQPVRRETTAGKMLIDKSPNGARSPNLADAVIIAACPAERNSVVSEGVMY